jgi:hypothetical protein
MKHILTILSLLISFSLFSQVVVKVPGQDISGKVNYSDSLSKYVTPSQLGTKVDTSHHDITSVFAPLYSVNVNDSTHELHAYVSTDTTFSGASDTTLSSSLAVKKYATLQNVTSISGSTTNPLQSPQINKIIFIDGIKYPKTGAGIQAAINDLPARGGEILLPADSIMIDTTIMIVDKEVTIIGQGIGWLGIDSNATGTYLRMANGANCDMFNFSSTGTTHTFFGKFSDFGMDGNKANQTLTSNGITVSGSYSDLTFNNVQVGYFNGNGMNIDNPQRVWNVWITNSWIEYNASAQIYLHGLSYLFVNWIHVDNCHIVGDQGVNGISIYNVSRVFLTNNLVTEAGHEGILLKSVRNSIIAENIVEDNGKTSPNTYDGIVITDDGTTASSGIIVSQNISTNYTLSNQRYGLSILGLSDKIFVSSNYLLNNLTGEINLVAANTNGSIAQVYNGIYNFSKKIKAPAYDNLTDSLGYWGINNTHPKGLLDVGMPTGLSRTALSGVSNFYGADQLTGQLGVWSTDAATVGKGGSFSFGGENTAGSTPYIYAKIGGAKEGATNTFNGYLSFYTTNTNSSITEKVRLGSNGHIFYLSNPSMTTGDSLTFTPKKYVDSVFANVGASVASASAIVPTGNTFHVTGTTAITSITATNVKAGQIITIIFDGALTFTDGNNLKLAGNFTTSADATITLRYDGTNFYEMSRSIN